MNKVKIPKSQIICFVLIIIVCIIAIVEALYYVMNSSNIEKENVASNSIDNNVVANTNLVDDFDNIFLNIVTIMENASLKLSNIDILNLSMSHINIIFFIIYYDDNSIYCYLLQYFIVIF